MKDFYLIIPGIETDATDQFHWSRRLATQIEVSTNAKAEAYQYHVKWYSRWIHQQRNVDSVVRKIKERSPTERVHLIGHSNGCDLILRALRALRQVDGMTVVHTLHLYSGATDPDFRSNGLNDALEQNDLFEVHIYCSHDDWVLKRLAPVSRGLGHWVGLGFDNLGYVGPRGVLPSVEDDVTVHLADGFGHGTWFDEAFDITAGYLIRNQQLNENPLPPNQ